MNREVWFNMEFNNKGLKKCFPGTIITKKKIVMGAPDSSFIIKAIQSSDLKYDHQGFNLLDLEIEGEYNSWMLSLKLELF